MTGTLKYNTAFHSAQLSGVIANSCCVTDDISHPTLRSDMQWMVKYSQ